MELTYKQIKWLDKHGGRIEDDLKADDDGLYIELSNGRGGIIKLYMPY